LSATDRTGNARAAWNGDIAPAVPNEFAHPNGSAAGEDPGLSVMAPRSVRTKVSILMCAYNEQQRIAQAIHEVLFTPYPCDIELIVVDDGSTDGTAAIVEQFDDPRIILHRHAENRGKGAALRTASLLATGTHILPFDADLEYSSEDIPRLIEPVIKRRYDVVYGVRLFGNNTVYQSYRYAIGNRLLTTTANMLFDAYLSDLHTCLKLVPLDLFRSLNLRERGFGLDTELSASLLRLGVRPFEVPVSYYSRSHAQGKKINWRDAFPCLRILLRVRMTRRKRLWLTAPEDLSPPAPGEQPSGQLSPGVPGGWARHEVPNLAAFSPGAPTSEEANAAAAG
jgi:glycosyltransferase involved in cell wall biosynthesis